MIITAKEYPILWKSINEFSYNQQNLEGCYRVLKYLIDYFFEGQQQNFKEKDMDFLKSLIETKSWQNLPEIDLSHKDYTVNVFHHLSPVNYLILQKNFRQVDIDFILELQKSNNGLLLNPEETPNSTYNIYNKKFYDRSKFFINLVINNDYPITTSEQHTIFKTILDKLVQTYQKDTHKDTLALIYKSIHLNYPTHDTLTWFKNFMTTNPHVSQNASKIFSTIKKEIKDYDLDKYFSLAEIKDLYANENTGIYIKKVESMICELDVNVIASNHKKASILEINKNFRVLEQTIVRYFKDQPDFAGSTPTLTEPTIIFRFMFEKGTLSKYEDILENLIEEISSYPKLVDSSHIENLVSSTFLAAKLEKNLPNKPLAQNKKKI